MILQSRQCSASRCAMQLIAGRDKAWERNRLLLDETSEWLGGFSCFEWELQVSAVHKFGLSTMFDSVRFKMTSSHSMQANRKHQCCTIRTCSPSQLLFCSAPRWVALQEKLRQKSHPDRIFCSRRNLDQQAFNMFLKAGYTWLLCAYTCSSPLNGGVKHCQSSTDVV